MPELLADLPEAKAMREELSQALESVRTAANAGEAVQAAKLFFERLSGNYPGTKRRLLSASPQEFLGNRISRDILGL